MTKNIEMNVKTSTGYDLLYPVTESRQVLNLLTDSTKTYIGLDSSSTPDDAFRSLYLLNVLSDKASFRLTVKTARGTPLANLPVTCNKYLDSNSNPVAGPLYTDENGVIDTFFANGNVTLSVTGYADLGNWSQQYTVVNGEQYEKEVALTTRNFLKITSSGNYKFSANVSRVDVSVVGGGGGGGGSVGKDELVASGGGGGGGYVTNQESVPFVTDKDYSAVIGAGGTAGTPAGGSNISSATNGGDGGTTSFLSIIAKGGEGGIKGNSNGPGRGGVGNGDGAEGVSFDGIYGSPEEDGNNGENASMQGYGSFTDLVLYGGGGGSGGCGERTSSSMGGKGGSPGGGDGGSPRYNNEGQNGVNGGGGGGGSAGMNLDRLSYKNSGLGGSGCVAIRMHLKAT